MSPKHQYLLELHSTFWKQTIERISVGCSFHVFSYKALISKLQPTTDHGNWFKLAFGDVECLHAVNMCDCAQQFAAVPAPRYLAN